MIRPRVGTIRRRVLLEVLYEATRPDGKPGLSDENLERRLRRPHTTVSSARNWLREQGWITDSGHRALTTSGRPAVLWRPTEAAFAAARRGELMTND